MPLKNKYIAIFILLVFSQVSWGDECLRPGLLNDIRDSLDKIIRLLPKPKLKPKAAIKKSPSEMLLIGSKIRGIENQDLWGRLIARLPDNTGWQLNTGRKALDKTFGKKWEVILYDADGNELFGDNDKLWWKEIPPESDVKASLLYKDSDLNKRLSTDGYSPSGQLYLLYFDKEGEIQDIGIDFGILKYLSTKKPLK